MSYLQRTGNGRNNISWTNTSSNSIKYLHRTGNNRTNIKWSTISTSANILQRTGTSRNNIKWSILTVMTEEGSLAKNTLLPVLQKANGEIGYPFGSYRNYGTEGTVSDNGTYFVITPVRNSYPDSSTDLKIYFTRIYPRNDGETLEEYCDRANGLCEPIVNSINGKKVCTKINAPYQRGRDEFYDFTNITCRAMFTKFRVSGINHVLGEGSGKLSITFRGDYTRNGNFYEQTSVPLQNNVKFYYK